jgi:hypothetical protein
MNTSQVLKVTGSAWVIVMLTAAAGCEDKTTQPPASTLPATGTSAPSSPPKAVAAAPDAKVREGRWEANSPGRGVAYTVESKGGVVTLNMGGTVFEGTDHEGGRRYKTASNEYLVVPTSDGFELRTKDKPTWRVIMKSDSVVLAAEGMQLSLDRAGDAIEIKKGTEVVGKVQTEGPKVKVTDASGAVKWDGTDGLMGAWGVLLMTDIGQPMQRLLFTEVLARGR